MSDLPLNLNEKNTLKLTGIFMNTAKKQMKSRSNIRPISFYL